MKLGSASDHISIETVARSQAELLSALGTVGERPVHNVLFVQYDSPVSKILGVFFWNLDSVLL